MTGSTAAEIIDERTDAAKPMIGLITWKNAPLAKILKSDVSIAKNYLIEHEIKELEQIVTMYLDYAENQAVRQIPMRMADKTEDYYETAIRRQTTVPAWHRKL